MFSMHILCDLCHQLRQFFFFFSGHVPHALRLGPIGLPPYRIFTLEELEEATNNFHPSNLLGEGSMGQVHLYLFHISLK